MKKFVNNIFKWVCGWIKGVDAVMLFGIFLTLMWFDVDWCLSTTFRPMSLPQLYLVNFTVSLVLLLPWMLSRNRIVGLALILIIAILSEANLIYCRTYFNAIPPQDYLLAGNMMDFTDSIWPNLRWSDLGFVIILALVTLCSFRLKYSSKREKLKPYLVLTLISALISYVYILCLGGFFKAYDSLVQDFKTYTSGVPTYTIAGHIAYKLMEEGRMKNVDPEELKIFEEWMREHKERYEPVRCVDTRKNVVLLICESLESWPIGLNIDGKEVTPFLNSLVEDSTTFFAPNVMTQVCGGRSIDGQLIYTTGLLPTSNAVYSNKYPERYYPSLNKLLKKDRNAKSILMTTDKPITWNMLAVEKAFGYDTIFHHYSWKQDEMINRKLSDNSFFRQSIEQLRKGELWPEDSPTMLTFITASGHSPFTLNKELRDPEFDISTLGMPKMLEDYITITHYVDSQLKQVVDYIKSRKDYEDTMIVILGDHEGLGVSRSELLHSSEVASEFVGKGRFTPLIIVNAPVAERYEGVMGQVDVFPTIIDMLGIEGEDWRGVGISVLDESRPKVAFSVIPLESEGDTRGYDTEELDHIRTAQRVSELIIVHDLFGKR